MRSSRPARVASAVQVATACNFSELDAAGVTARSTSVSQRSSSTANRANSAPPAANLLRRWHPARMQLEGPDVRFWMPFSLFERPSPATRPVMRTGSNTASTSPCRKEDPFGRWPWARLLKLVARRPICLRGAARLPSRWRCRPLCRAPRQTAKFVLKHVPKGKMMAPARKSGDRKQLRELSFETARLLVPQLRTASRDVRDGCASTFQYQAVEIAIQPIEHIGVGAGRFQHRR